VIYIAGSGRSGSTLLERTLGAIPSFTAVGELLDLPRKVAPRNEMCGCSQPFAECPFWQGVGQRLGGWDPAWLAETHRLQAAVVRQRHLPKLLALRKDSAFAQQLQDYAQRYRDLIAAVAAQRAAAGPEHRGPIVDASKWPVLGYALHRAGLDIRVIHLIRDVRGVAHSLSKSDIERPHSTDASAPDLMFHNSPAGGAARWLTTQTTVDLLARRGLPVARLAYTDFVADPGPSIQRTLAALGLNVSASDLAHITGTNLQLGPAHGLSGNPSRFRHGTTTLRPDDRWRAEMRRTNRWLSTAIGLPQLWRLQSITHTGRTRTAQPTGKNS
jgi:Sulfotransferase family